VIDGRDRHCVDFIAKSPLLLLSTASADGICHGSPKGGPPGFVQVLDDRRLAWADFSGNIRLDSFQDLVTNAHAALDAHPAVIEDSLEQGLQSTLWEPGGADPRLSG